MLRVKSVDETKNIIKENFSKYHLETEKIKLEEAVGRIIAADVLAPDDIPTFHRSTVDGYAVKSSDTFGSSETLPSQLKLVGEIKMGEKLEILPKEGETLYIPTGGELPENTDAVVMIEYSEDLNDGYIYIHKASAPGNNVVYIGDDAKKGAVIIEKDSVLRPQDIGVLAAMGFSQISVKRKLQIGIISTGDEIIDIDEEPYGSQVRDVNAYAIYGDLIRPSCKPVRYGIVKDTTVEIKNKVQTALKECDILLISGGSSVGIKDETFNVIHSLGSPGVILHGIAVKPGKPTIIGKISEKAIVGLPGHPVSAFVIHHIFVNHLINTMLGIPLKITASIAGTMAVNYPSNNGREEYLPVQFQNESDKMMIYPVFGKSGLISTLSNSQGYIHISRGNEGLNKGDIVEVFLWT
ncbi:MAG: gephyrin-like molybdotransferase Glp [Eubacteriales bacterium]